MANARMLNKAKVLARLGKVPKSVAVAAGAQLIVEVEDLIEAQKRAAPVDETSDNPGQLRDSINARENPDRPLSYRIVSNARDPAGKPISANVEHGHRAVDGTHVAAVPFFFPTYRARKKGMRQRILAKSRAALRQLYPE